jgi:hypothetical protein
MHDMRALSGLLADALDKEGLGPQGDPTFFDLAQRDLPGLWAAGLSLREIVGLLIETRRVMLEPPTVAEMSRSLERRYLPDWMLP